MDAVDEKILKAIQAAQPATVPHIAACLRDMDVELSYPELGARIRLLRVTGKIRFASGVYTVASAIRKRKTRKRRIQEQAPQHT